MLNEQELTNMVKQFRPGEDDAAVTEIVEEVWERYSQREPPRHPRSASGDSQSSAFSAACLLMPKEHDPSGHCTKTSGDGRAQARDGGKPFETEAEIFGKPRG